MAGRHQIKSHGLRLLHKQPEFYELVAHDARVGRVAAEILAHEIRDDSFLEPAAEIQHVMPNAEMMTHPSCVGNIVHGTTAAGPSPVVAGVPQPQSNTRHIVPPLL